MTSIIIFLLVANKKEPFLPLNSSDGHYIPLSNDGSFITPMVTDSGAFIITFIGDRHQGIYLFYLLRQKHLLHPCTTDAWVFIMPTDDDIYYSSWPLAQEHLLLSLSTETGVIIAPTDHCYQYIHYVYWSLMQKHSLLILTTDLGLFITPTNHLFWDIYYFHGSLKHWLLLIPLTTDAGVFTSPTQHWYKGIYYSHWPLTPGHFLKPGKH